MTWTTKAHVQRFLSMLPGSVGLNYMLQRYVARTLPCTDAEFTDRFSTARLQISKLKELHGRPWPERIFFEFGAGRDLLGPLVFWCFGVEKQIVVDLHALARPFLIKDLLLRFRLRKDELELPRTPERLIRSTWAGALEDLKRFYGIEYQAPADARNTGLSDASIDTITSTTTLEHIPPGEVTAILNESRRILRPDGFISFVVDYQDHWSHSDSGIDVYNFLRYSESRWNKSYNTALNYQNRLRHVDYLRLYAEAGLHVHMERRGDGTPEDFARILAMPLDGRFQAYTAAELAVKTGWVILRRRGPLT